MLRCMPDMKTHGQHDARRDSKRIPQSGIWIRWTYMRGTLKGLTIVA
jgi:hypothetical protein